MEPPPRWGENPSIGGENWLLLGLTKSGVGFIKVDSQLLPYSNKISNTL
jgi:hypothetical protein